MIKNRTLMQYFEWYINPEENLWKKVKESAEHLKKIGITDIWLPPAYKGEAGNRDAGYGVYDLYDLGEFNQKGSIDTKYGTKDEYLSAIKELHKYNINVYADIVLNHKMGADESEEVFATLLDYNDRNIEKGTLEKIIAWTKYTFPARKNKYSSFKWDYSHFGGTDWDELQKRNGIFRFCGRHWNSDVDLENGNYDFLMGEDIDFDNVEVVEELKKWGKWYLNITEVDGFRLDAVKHISAKFMKEWIDTMQSEKDVLCVGEYWNRNIDSLKNYINETNNKIPLFDVPLHYNFYEASNKNSDYDLSKIFENTLVNEKPNMAVTFVDNHDTEPGQALFSWIEDWFKPLAYSLILLRESGLPCIFYGDYYGIPSQNISSKSYWLNNLVVLRADYGYGEQIDYFDNPNLIAWVRKGDSQHIDSGLVAIMSNKDGGSKKINLGESFSKATFYDYLGNVDKEVILDEFGNGTFLCNSRSVSVWVKKPEEKNDILDI